MSPTTRSISRKGAKNSMLSLEDLCSRFQTMYKACIQEGRHHIKEFIATQLPSLIQQFMCHNPSETFKAKGILTEPQDLRNRYQINKVSNHTDAESRTCHVRELQLQVLILLELASQNDSQGKARGLKVEDPLPKPLRKSLAVFLGDLQLQEMLKNLSIEKPSSPGESVVRSPMDMSFSEFMAYITQRYSSSFPRTIFWLSSKLDCEIPAGLQYLQKVDKAKSSSVFSRRVGLLKAAGSSGQDLGGEFFWPAKGKNIFGEPGSAGLCEDTSKSKILNTQKSTENTGKVNRDKEASRQVGKPIPRPEKPVSNPSASFALPTRQHINHHAANFSASTASLKTRAPLKFITKKPTKPVASSSPKSVAPLGQKENVRGIFLESNNNQGHKIALSQPALRPGGGEKENNVQRVESKEQQKKPLCVFNSPVLQRQPLGKINENGPGRRLEVAATPAAAPSRSLPRGDKETTMVFGTPEPRGYKRKGEMTVIADTPTSSKQKA